MAHVTRRLAGRRGMRAVRTGGICLTAAPNETKPLLGEIRPEGVCSSTQCETQNEGRERVALIEPLQF